MRNYSILALIAFAVTGCSQRDVRADQQAECRRVGGVYHMGNDWDDDVCVISRDEVIIFDNREAES